MESGTCRDLIKKKEEVLREIDEEIRHIRYEKISYEIYGYETEKEKLVAERSEQEIEITRLTLAKENLLREINKYDLLIRLILKSWNWK